MPQDSVNAPYTAYTRGRAWSSASSASSAAQASSLYPAGPGCQPCPDCGGLECLCRPRFFAGQLLTEQDLNRLDEYIVAKNRLHNRYLVGHGVVCGLEVVCSPCQNTVTVSPGYAIDPCGSDIIVCAQNTVDICKLINACMPSTSPDCSPYRDTSFCKDLEQEWILAIRYQEAPSRGTTPLTGSSQCACGSGASACICGGAAGSCGCGGKQSAASCCGQTVANTPPVSANGPRRGAPPECEPTVTCEAYRYEVFLAPQTTPPPEGTVRGIAGLAGTLGGDLFARMRCCFQTLAKMLPTAPANPPGQDQAGWSAYCCNLRLALITYLTMQGGTDCEAIAKLQAVNCPKPDSDTFTADLKVAYETELLVMIEILLGCFCLAALPACLPPGDPRVPLARVRVRSSDCTIVSVCDWTPLRKHVVTTKTLGYWLGWLPFVPMIRQLMQEICCAVFGLPRQLGFRTNLSAAGGTAEDVQRADIQRGDQTFDEPISFAGRSYQASNPISEAIVANLARGATPLTFADLAQALLDPVDPGTSGQQGSAERLAQTPHAKLLAEIARPLVDSFGPLLSAARGLKDSETVASMQAELDSLRATVAAHQSALDALRKPEDR
ncbi:hypothetical protein [Paraburkholderia sp. MM5477-R1]|uniref:hypothetical protein n=1 Tax=Paraburkholderia sp. MM5477-R1 TaxID=2991062 RepID=UPI003D238F7A